MKKLMYLDTDYGIVGEITPLIINGKNLYVGDIVEIYLVYNNSYLKQFVVKNNDKYFVMGIHGQCNNITGQIQECWKTKFIKSYKDVKVGECYDGIIVVQKENKPLTLSDIEVGMKVVPFKKTVYGWGDFKGWMRSETLTVQFFKQNGFLYIMDVDDPEGIALGNKIDSGGDYFNISDFKLYKEFKPKPQISETVIIEFQPYNVTATLESSKDNYSEVFIRNISAERETVKIIFNGNTTICILEDGTKGVTKCNERDTYDENIGKDIACYRARIKQMENKIEKLCR